MLVGARDEKAWQRWHVRWIVPAERVRRVLLSDYGTWACEPDHLQTRRGREDQRGRGEAELKNDGLLAAASREHGYMIVTHDRQDFELIALVAPAVYPEQQRMLAYVLLRQGTML
jgi:predicted nucleic acid-binding protein